MEGAFVGKALLDDAGVDFRGIVRATRPFACEPWACLPKVVDKFFSVNPQNFGNGWESPGWRAVIEAELVCRREAALADEMKDLLNVWRCGLEVMAHAAGWLFLSVTTAVFGGPVPEGDGRNPFLRAASALA